MECSLNDSCWCYAKPRISLDIEKKDCLCPKCLEDEMAQIINISSDTIPEDIKKQILKSSNGVDGTLTEGVDFSYDEQGMMVLSKWYLLKRGYCCNNGCLNCPY